MDRLPLRWKQLLKLFCMVAVIDMAVPSSSARAEEVQCREPGSRYRCFRAESGVMGQINSWIASVNARIPAGQELVGYRHFDGANMNLNWFLCSTHAPDSTVDNLGRAEPMSTSDYRQNYCPTGEVVRWLHSGRIYRVPVSAIPTPGERNHNLAVEVATQLRDGVVATQERSVDVLSQCIANETDLTGMRPDRSETAECLSAARDLVAHLPAVAPAPAPVVQEVVRPSGYITMHDTAESGREAMPIWMLALFGAGLLLIGIAIGKFSNRASNQVEVWSLKAKLKRSTELAKEKIEEINTLTKQLMGKPSTAEIMSMQAKSTRWTELEACYREAHLSQKGTEPQGTDVFSADLMQQLVERWFKPSIDPVRQGFERVWADLGLTEYSEEYLRLLLTSGRAFQVSREKSDKMDVNRLADATDSYGNTLEAIPLLKEDLRRLTGELREASGAVLIVGGLQEQAITTMQRLQTFALQLGGKPEQFHLPDPSLTDEVNEFVQRVIEHAFKAYRSRGTRNDELRKTITELTPILRERKSRIADLEKTETDLRREIGMMKVSLHDETTKSSQYRGLRFQLAEQLDEITRAHRTQAKLLVKTESELEFSIVQASHAEQFIKDSSREMHEFSGSLESLGVFDPTMNEFFQELRAKFEGMLIKALNYQLPKAIPSNGAHHGGPVRMDVPIDATGTS